MLKISSILMLTFMLSSVLYYCSDNNPRRQRLTPQEQAQQLKEVLDLTDQQVESVEKIYGYMQEELSKLREEYNADDRSAMREVFMEMREKAETSISEILTDEQKEKYQVFLQERRERMRERRERRPDRE